MSAPRTPDPNVSHPEDLRCHGRWSERLETHDSRRGSDCSGNGRPREGREGLGRRELLEYLDQVGVISAAPRETRRKGCKRTL